MNNQNNPRNEFVSLEGEKRKNYELKIKKENRTLILRIRKIRYIKFEENQLNLEFTGFLNIFSSIISKKFHTNIKFYTPYQNKEILLIEKLSTKKIF